MVAAEAQDFLTYITELREHATPEALLGLRPGAPLQLRHRHRRGIHRTEICTLQGEPLGWLPAEDSMALGDADAACAAEVTALVPARLLPRVHIRIFMPI